MLSFLCLNQTFLRRSKHIRIKTCHIRSFTKNKKDPTTPRSLLHRDTSVLTQGGVFSQRDPSKLRAFNKQIDEFAEYQEPLLPDMPFKYDDESLIISPTIKNSKNPIPKSMKYIKDDQQQQKNEDDIYPPLEYFDMANIEHHRQQKLESFNYKHTKTINPKASSTLNSSHQNINVRLQRLFSSNIPPDKQRQQLSQPSKELIKERLTKPTPIDAEDMMMNGENSAYSAEQSKKTLEFAAIQMENEEEDEDGEFDLSEHMSQLDEMPNFEELYPDDEEREIEIDRYLKKAPSVDKKSVPPDCIVLPVYGELKEYSKMLNVERNVISATLRHMGIYTHNIITQEAGQQLVEHLRPNMEIILEELVDELEARLPYDKESEEYAKLEKRKPVLCILGHVDHGKTTLLDYLRHSHVAEKEAGGITQSIGAFPIDLVTVLGDHGITSHYDELIVFDTPGHAAFTGMRQRGANVVDIAILVIDTCDGVKPQTKESLAIIRREKIPFIVALNKIDLPASEPNKIKKELKELGVFDDEIEMIEVSAKNGDGVVDLLEMVDIICELEDPRGCHSKNAELVVVEAKKSQQEGTVINALVQDGMLKNGDTLLKMNGFDKDCHCKVSRLQDSKGQIIEFAGPSTPVSFLGFDKNLPEVGTILIAANDDRHASDIIKLRQTHEYYRNKLKIHARVSTSHPKLYDPTAAMASQFSSNSNEELEEDNLDIESKWTTTPHTNDPRQLNIWIRADTWGSIEALENYLYQIVIPNDEYYFHIIGKDIGPLYESVIKEVDSRNCYILNFNVPIKKGQYKTKHVQIFDSNIIFDLFNKLIETLEDRLAPIEEHKLCGRAYVKEVFEVGNDGNKSFVAGCIIETGRIKYDGHYRVKRNGKIIYEQWGVSELKHFAVNVDEVESGDECGLKLEFEDWRTEDLIECLDIVQEKNKIAPPIFDLDPSLQKSLFSGASHKEASAEHMHEAHTVFSYAEDAYDEYNDDKFTTFEDDYKDKHEFVGNHKNKSDKPKVRAAKNEKGNVTFEAVK